eukprot:PhM_4_TR480/c0_g1_i1/m.61059
MSSFPSAPPPLAKHNNNVAGCDDHRAEWAYEREHILIDHLEQQLHLEREHSQAILNTLHTERLQWKEKQSTYERQLRQFRARSIGAPTFTSKMSKGGNKQLAMSTQDVGVMCVDLQSTDTQVQPSPAALHSGGNVVTLTASALMKTLNSALREMLIAALEESAALAKAHFDNFVRPLFLQMCDQIRGSSTGYSAPKMDVERNVNHVRDALVRLRQRCEYPPVRPNVCSDDKSPKPNSTAPRPQAMVSTPPRTPERMTPPPNKPVQLQPNAIISPSRSEEAVSVSKLIDTTLSSASLDNSKWHDDFKFQARDDDGTMEQGNTSTTSSRAALIHKLISEGIISPLTPTDCDTDAQAAFRQQIQTSTASSHNASLDSGTQTPSMSMAAAGGCGAFSVNVSTVVEELIPEEESSSRGRGASSDSHQESSANTATTFGVRSVLNAIDRAELLSSHQGEECDAMDDDGTYQIWKEQFLANLGEDAE